MRRRFRTIILLALLTVLAVAIEGYHFATEDGAIYVPAIARFAHPQLYPFGADFFLSHGHLSVFAALAGGVASELSLSVAWSVFFWYVFGTWLLMTAAWKIATICFPDNRARWAAVGLLAALLPVQVAGTSIPIMDPYFTARTLSTPLSLLAVAAALRERWALASIYIFITLFVHPQMAFCAGFLLTAIAVSKLWRAFGSRRISTGTVSGGIVSMGPLRALFPSGAATGSYATALYSRTYLFAKNWTLPQWIGVVAPLLIMLWISRSKAMPITEEARRISELLVLTGSLATLAFLALSSSHGLDSLVRLQPMRIFQLVYIFMFLFLGGLVGQYVLRGHLWRALIFFSPLALGMYALDRSIYPASFHLELPGRAEVNPWLQGFAWIRANTPQNAVFAIDPLYLKAPEEDGHGFRAFTERSVLADSYKDSGVAAMFPAIAPEWGREVDAQQGWRHFTRPQFERLASNFPVTWVVVDPSEAAGLDCRFSNRAVAVCRIGTAATSP